MFVLKETELCGIINLISSILLVDGAFNKGPQPSKLLPQTVLSLTMIIIKFFNNISRISLDLL